MLHMIMHAILHPTYLTPSVRCFRQPKSKSNSNSNSTGHAKALPATTRRSGTWYAPLRPLHHSTCHMVRTFRFLHYHPLFIATMEQRRKDWEESYGRQLREGGPEPRAEGAPKTRAEGAPPSTRGISLLA